MSGILADKRLGGFWTDRSDPYAVRGHAPVPRSAPWHRGQQPGTARFDDRAHPAGGHSVHVHGRGEPEYAALQPADHGPRGMSVDEAAWCPQMGLGHDDDDGSPRPRYPDELGQVTLGEVWIHVLEDEGGVN